MQSFIDELIQQADLAIRSLFAHDPLSSQPYPAATLDSVPLSDSERQHSGALMRINHCGEICAQALYQGQALMARESKLSHLLNEAAIEEQDHLAWCQRRLDELGAAPSYLNPIWYLGSLSLGCLAGFAGDKWSLGFIKETEEQVVRHLKGHLQKLSPEDKRSRAIVRQMQLDEQQHAVMAERSGAAELPDWIKVMMRQSAKVMTTLSYYV